MKSRYRRLIWIVAGLGALAVAATLVLNAFRGNLVFFFTPTQIANAKTIVVAFTGILPDLFKEGRGVVAKGSLLADGTFKASEVLAKHDENYMPPEAAEALKRAGHPVGAPTQFQQAAPAKP